MAENAIICPSCGSADVHFTVTAEVYYWEKPTISDGKILVKGSPSISDSGDEGEFFCGVCSARFPLEGFEVHVEHSVDSL